MGVCAMNQLVAVPEVDVIASLLSAILDRQVKAEIAAPMDLRSQATRVYGVYRDAELLMTCVCVLDLPLSVYAAGALLAFPACTINDALRTGAIEEGLFDAVREVLNICAQMFKDCGHKVLEQVHIDSDALPDDARAVLRSPMGRIDLSVSIMGSGSGKMSVLVDKDTTRINR